MTKITKKLFGTEKSPRVAIFRSNMAIYAQAIDDSTGKTLVAASSLELKKKDKPIALAEETGKLFAQKAKEAKVAQIVFDRNGYQYHGRVKAIAEGMREGGLNF